MSGGSESRARHIKTPGYNLAQTHGSSFFRWGNQGPQWHTEAGYKSQDLGLPPPSIAVPSSGKHVSGRAHRNLKGLHALAALDLVHSIGLHHSSSQTGSFQAWLMWPISIYFTRWSKGKTAKAGVDDRLLVSGLPVPCHVQDVQLSGPWHLCRDPSQPVVAHAEHGETAAPADLWWERKHDCFPGFSGRWGWDWRVLFIKWHEKDAQNNITRF